MQFSSFQKNLDNWQGASLIFGVLEEDIAGQLENIKFVIDPKLLLKKVTQKKFIGETNSANKRWKGEHDCKNYLMNYKEALAHNKLSSHQDIRFFLDVPKEVKLRRKLEQQLIYLWLPPFNKETRDRWATTFTNN